MKAMKKVFAMLLAVVMVLSLSVTAFAASDGSITITNATVGQTYEVYKLFDATYATTGTGTDAKTNVAYTITATDSNTALITALKSDDSVFTLTASATNSSVYVVTVKEGKEDADVIAYVKSIADKLGKAVATQKATSTDEEATTTTVKFTGLDYGYYYVTSTLGTLVTIDSALKDVEITDKNTAPSNDKDVQEDSDSSWGNSNTADLGQTVNFKSTIKAYAGAAGYVLHDTMSAGLTFDSSSVKVEVINEDGDVTKTLTAYVDDNTAWDYKVVTPGTETGEGVTACTFEVVFNQTYLDTITGTSENPTTIVVSYSATVNENAVIGGNGNPNSSSLQYSNADETTKTPDSTTTTYVFDVDILKYTAGENDTKTPLSGAEFVLYKTVTENEVDVNYYAKVTDGKLTGWTTTKSEATTLTSGEDGKISVDGLDADTYYLEETKAPAGYNLLTAPVEFKIDDEGNVSVKSGDTYQTATNCQIDVENKTGSELPSTGGIGTTIFYVVGTVLVLGAAVLLITRKRMSSAER